MNISVCKVDYTKHNWLVFKHAQKWLTEWARHIRGTVYDLGCGERPYEDFILQHGDKYIGVDWSNTMHEFSADIVADLNQPLFMINDESADTVFSVSVIEHLCEPQIFLNEACRILKKNGVMLLQVPFQWHIHEAPYDYYRYTEYGLKYMFTKAGFYDVKITPSAGFWSTIMLKINYYSTKFIRGPRIVKNLLNVIAIPFWFTDQYFAFFMDKIDAHSVETAGYTVVAVKN